MKLTRITSIAPYNWHDILYASQSEGFNLVNRLVTDFRTGRNRFDASGEALFAYLSGNKVGAVAGLNREPDETLSKAGRVRRLYVLPEFRGRGIGRCLVGTIIDAAKPYYKMLTVNVGKIDARRFYEHLGFTPVHHTSITHTKELTHDIMLDDTVANRAGSSE